MKILDWLEAYSLSLHLLVIVIGATAFLAALFSGDWRPLLITAVAYWITTKT